MHWMDRQRDFSTSNRLGRRQLLAAAASLPVFPSLTTAGQNQNTRNEQVADEETYYEYFPFDDDCYLHKFSPIVTEYKYITNSFSRTDGALRVDIPDGSHYGALMSFDTNEQWNDQLEELHARYWIYVPDDFDFEHQVKLPFIGNQDLHGGGGRTSDGTGGWSTRVALHENSATGPGLEFYTYHADMEGPYGDHHDWEVGISPGEWSRIDFYVKLNTPGEHDGEIRGWLNSELGHEVTELMFREQGYEEYSIDEFGFDVYHGGDEPAPSGTFLVFNNLELYANQGSVL